MTCVSCPPSIVWDQMEEAAEYLLQYEPMPVMESTMEPIGKLMDDVLKMELKGNGIVSHHMRLFLLSLATDQWVQGRMIVEGKADQRRFGHSCRNCQADPYGDITSSDVQQGQATSYDDITSSDVQQDCGQ
jgi:hypothetical protein